MNAKQRRLVRRAIDREMAVEMAYQMGDDEAKIPCAARHVQGLVNRAPGHRSPRRRYSTPGFPDGRRDPAAYGHRCYACGRKAVGADDARPFRWACREHGEWVPF